MLQLSEKWGRCESISVARRRDKEKTSASAASVPPFTNKRKGGPATPENRCPLPLFEKVGKFALLRNWCRCYDSLAESGVFQGSFSQRLLLSISKSPHGLSGG